MRITFLLSIFLCFFAAGNGSIETVAFKDNEITETIDQLLLAMQELFSTSQNVAKWKWNHKAAIEELEKEKSFIEKIVQKGINFGLPAELLKEIVKAQVEAMKMIQVNYFDNWKREGIDRFTDVMDYRSEIRPQLERIYENFMMQLKKTMPLLKKKNLSEVIKLRAAVILSADVMNDAVRETALQPLLMFCAQVTLNISK